MYTCIYYHPEVMYEDMYMSSSSQCLMIYPGWLGVCVGGGGGTAPLKLYIATKLPPLLFMVVCPEVPYLIASNLEKDILNV